MSPTTIHLYCIGTTLGTIAGCSSDVDKKGMSFWAKCRAAEFWQRRARVPGTHYLFSCQAKTKP